MAGLKWAASFGMDDCTLERIISQNRFLWVGHALTMQAQRLPIHELYDLPGPGWKKDCDGQAITWLREMKKLITYLLHIWSSWLSGWGSKDRENFSLVSLKDMAQDRSQVVFVVVIKNDKKNKMCLLQSHKNCCSFDLLPFIVFRCLHLPIVSWFVQYTSIWGHELLPNMQKRFVSVRWVLRQWGRTTSGK